MKRFWIELHLCLIAAILVAVAIVCPITAIAGKAIPTKGYLLVFGLTYFVMIISVPIAKLIAKIGERFEN